MFVIFIVIVSIIIAVKFVKYRICIYKIITIVFTKKNNWCIINNNLNCVALYYYKNAEVIMSDSNKSNLDLSSVKNTRENIAQMEKILSLMEEVDSLKKTVGAQGENGAGADAKFQGVSRDELKGALARMKADAARAETSAAQFVSPAQEDDAESRDKLNAEIRSLKAQVESLSKMQKSGNELETVQPQRHMSTVESFKAGDNTLMMEGIYNSLSDQIEDMKKHMLKQFEYKLMQDSSIYEDMLREIQKLNPVTSFDIQDIADKISKAMPAAPAAPAQIVRESAADDETKAELAEIKAMLSKMGGADDYEYSLLGYEIVEFMKTGGEDSLKELLQEAKDLKQRAARFIDNGNIEKGKMLLAGLKSRLASVTFTGSAALGMFITCAESVKYPASAEYSSLRELQKRFRNYELESLIPNVDTINEIITLKKNTFKSSELTVRDKQVFIEMSEAAEGVTEVASINREKAESLKSLKAEMLGFNLDAATDYEIVRNADEDADSVLLKEIKALREELKGKNLAVSAAATEQKTERPEIKTVEGKPNAAMLEKSKKKNARILRPSVKSSDSKVEKTEKPLKIKRNHIKLKDDNPELLANILVDKVAENVAEKYIKNR